MHPHNISPQHATPTHRVVGMEVLQSLAGLPNLSPCLMKCSSHMPVSFKQQRGPCSQRCLRWRHHLRHPCPLRRSCGCSVLDVASGATYQGGVGWEGSLGGWVSVFVCVCVLERQHYMSHSIHTHVHPMYTLYTHTCTPHVHIIYTHMYKHHQSSPTGLYMTQQCMKTHPGIVNKTMNVSMPIAVPCVMKSGPSRQEEEVVVECLSQEVVVVVECFESEGGGSCLVFS